MAGFDFSRLLSQINLGRLAAQNKDALKAMIKQAIVDNADALAVVATDEIVALLSPHEPQAGS